MCAHPPRPAWLSQPPAKGFPGLCGHPQHDVRPVSQRLTPPAPGPPLLAAAATGCWAQGRGALHGFAFLGRGLRAGAASPFADLSRRRQELPKPGECPPGPPTLPPPAPTPRAEVAFGDGPRQQGERSGGHHGAAYLYPLASGPKIQNKTMLDEPRRGRGKTSNRTGAGRRDGGAGEGQGPGHARGAGGAGRAGQVTLTELLQLRGHGLGAQREGRGRSPLGGRGRCRGRQERPGVRPPAPTHLPVPQVVA